MPGMLLFYRCPTDLLQQDSFIVPGHAGSMNQEIASLAQRRCQADQHNVLKRSLENTLVVAAGDMRYIVIPGGMQWNHDHGAVEKVKRCAVIAYPVGIENVIALR